MLAVRVREQVSLENWQSRYSQPDRVWSSNPNPWLVEVAEQLVPGSALDVGCGEGADAIWLAAAGWTVTGLDFAPAALARASEHAHDAEVAGRITWAEQDLTSWRPHPRTADLVSVQFFHAPPDLRSQVHQRAWEATRRDLVIVGHDPTNATQGSGGPPDPAVLYSTEDVLNTLDLAEAEVSVSERRARNADDPRRLMWDSLLWLRRLSS